MGNIQKAIEFIEKVEADTEELKQEKDFDQKSDGAVNSSNDGAAINALQTAATSSIEELDPEVKAAILRMRPDTYDKLVRAKANETP